MSAPTLLGRSALPCLSPPQRLSSLLSLAPSLLSSSRVQPQPGMAAGVPGCRLRALGGSAGLIMVHLNPLSWSFVLWRQRDAWLENLQTAHPYAKLSFCQKTFLMFPLSAINSVWRSCPPCTKAADTRLAQPRVAVSHV